MQLFNGLRPLGCYFPAIFCTSRIYRQAYFRVLQTKFTIYQSELFMPTRNCYPALIVWAATARSGKSRSHTSNIVPALLAQSIWCKKKLQSSLYFLLSGFEPSLLFIYFSDSLNGCSHCTKVWRKNLSVMRRSIFEIGDAHLHSGTENLVEITKSGTIFVATQTLSGNVRTYRDGYKKMQKKRKKKRLLCLPIRWMESTCGPYKPLESSLIHRKSERSVLALKIEPFRWVKYSPIFESNLVPLTRANTSVQSTTADQDPRAEMGPVWTGIGAVLA